MRKRLGIWDLVWVEKACAGQVYTLVGDLGVGKTYLPRDLRKDWGSTEPVSSPTFTIVQVYEEGRLPFYHFDVYRIGDIEEMDEIGYEDYLRRGVPDRVGESDRRDSCRRITQRLQIEKDLEMGFDYRRITKASGRNMRMKI